MKRKNLTSVYPTNFQAQDYMYQGLKHTCNIIHNHSNRGVPNIAWNKASKSLLSSCIPENQRKKNEKKNKILRRGICVN